ncbi:MAG: hypothetical protein JO072_00985 [Parafilimonas sp.]|nr:hypothetical protein [Parafilimonas sp.]
MKRIAILICCFIVSMFFLNSCKKDSQDPNLPVLKLHPVNVTGKSGKHFLDTLDIYAPYGVGKLVLSKGINLVPDDAFGTQTVTPVSTGTNTYQYILDYTYQADEVNKLVGINFHFEDAKGNVAEKDLTINTSASASQIIYSHKWKLVSKLWTTANPQQESEQDCEKDNIFSYNPDSTMSVNYGTTGCTFDGFNIYDKWYVSDDEKTFTDVYHSVFNPDQITTEVYNIESLTNDKWVMDIALDLTVFGLSDHEVFVYTYVSQ